MPGPSGLGGNSEVAARRIAELLLSESDVGKLAAIPELLDDVLACAVARGVVLYRQPEAKAEAKSVGITLLPTPVAAEVYEEARALGPDFHVLMDRIACDIDWLAEALKETGRMDQICGRLLGICQRVYGKGRRDHSRDIRLHIMRNDFMLDARGQKEGKPMKQIELNMIAASFAGHAEDVTEVHRYVLTKYLQRLDNTLDSAAASAALDKILPRSPNAAGLAAAIADAHNSYTRRWPQSTHPRVVLFIVGEDEKNELDQRKLELALFSGHGIISLRRSLAQLGGQHGTLLAPAAAAGAVEPNAGGESPRVLVVDGHEVTVAYFRSGYWPGNYDPLEPCWAAREAVEVSEAVKCPSVPAQLAGMKKVQQLLCDTTHLHRFLPVEQIAGWASDQNQASRLSETFARQIDPSNETEAAQELVKAAKANPAEWVLKPQVEGSGELFFDDEIPQVLNSRSREELAEFILMERVMPPVTASAVYKTGDGCRAEAIIRDSVAELGIYGTFVSDGAQVLRNEVVGHLLRSKAQKTNQGGVFVGNAVVDAPILVPSDLFWSRISS